MPRTEARIFTSIWRDRAFTCLPPDAQWLYAFLLSQPDLTYCGTIGLRPANWRLKSAGMTVERIEDALKWLEGTAYPTDNPDPYYGHTPLIVADRDTLEVFVRSLIRRDGVWKQPNLLKLAIEAAELIDSLRIRGALLTELRRVPLEDTASAQVKTLVADFITGLEQGEPYPTPYPIPGPTGNPTGNPNGKDHACAQGSGGSVANPGISPDPLFPVPQQTPLSAQDRKLGKRLPEDWQPTQELLAWAAQTCPHVDAIRETERFRDHWLDKPGMAGRKVSWDRTWRNWMRTAEDRQKPRERPGAGNQRDQARIEQRNRQMARAEERERREPG